MMDISPSPPTALKNEYKIFQIQALPTGAVDVIWSHNTRHWQGSSVAVHSSCPYTPKTSRYLCWHFEHFSILLFKTFQAFGSKYCETFFHNTFEATCLFVLFCWSHLPLVKYFFPSFQSLRFFLFFFYSCLCLHTFKCHVYSITSM